MCDGGEHTFALVLRQTLTNPPNVGNRNDGPAAQTCRDRQDNFLNSQRHSSQRHVVIRNVSSQILGVRTTRLLLLAGACN